MCTGDEEQEEKKEWEREWGKMYDFNFVFFLN